MLIVLSPAKKISEEKQSLKDCTNPLFLGDAEKLINALRKYSPKKLSQLMSISGDLAELNVNRYKDWAVNHTKEVLPAALTFNGEAYTGLDAGSFSNREKGYAQNHLRILSGLYGLLKPYDLIRSHRLEMGTKLKVGRKSNLYQFWGDKIVDEINVVMQSQNQKTLVNLASTEYFKAVNQNKLVAPIITPIFKDFNNGQYKMVMVYAKKARGMMANYVIKNKIKKVGDLIGFDATGYCYNAAASTQQEMVFYRG